MREIILELARPQQPVVPFVTVTPLTEGNQAFAYELWFHLDGIVEQNEGTYRALSEENFAMFVEPQPNVVAQVPVEFNQLRPNVWNVFPSFGNQRTRSLVRMAFMPGRAHGHPGLQPGCRRDGNGFETLREYIDKIRAAAGGGD